MTAPTWPGQAWSCSLSTRPSCCAWERSAVAWCWCGSPSRGCSWELASSCWCPGPGATPGSSRAEGTGPPMGRPDRGGSGPGGQVEEGRRRPELARGCVEPSRNPVSGQRADVIEARPYALPLCGVWHDGAFAFCTGAEEQKMRNLAANPRVAVTAGPLGADGWSSGKDIVVEGAAERVTDGAALRALARGLGGQVRRRLALGGPRRAVLRAHRLRGQHRGRRPGVPGAALEGPGVRRRPRPDDVPVQLISAGGQ